MDAIYDIHNTRKLNDITIVRRLLSSFLFLTSLLLEISVTNIIYANLENIYDSSIATTGLSLNNASLIKIEYARIAIVLLLENKNNIKVILCNF